MSLTQQALNTTPLEFAPILGRRVNTDRAHSPSPIRPRSPIDREFCRSVGMPWISKSYAYLGLAHFWRRTWQEALENFQEAVELEPPGFFAGADSGVSFLAKAYIGDKDAALVMLERRRDGLPRPG